jgi:hypothetical protein
MYTRLTANGDLKGFVKKGDWQLTETDLLYLDERKYKFY